MKLSRSTTYHLTEGVIIRSFLRCFINGKPKQWAKWLHQAVFSNNMSPHIATKISSFHGLYRRTPTPVIRYGNNTTTIDSLEQLMVECDVVLDDLRFNVIRAQQKMKQLVDTHTCKMTIL